MRSLLGFPWHWTLSKLLFNTFVTQYRGKYVGPVAKLRELSKDAKREDLGDKLWETTERFLTGLGLYP